MESKQARLRVDEANPTCAASDNGNKSLIHAILLANGVLLEFKKFGTVGGTPRCGCDFGNTGTSKLAGLRTRVMEVSHTDPITEDDVFNRAGDLERNVVLEPL